MEYRPSGGTRTSNLTMHGSRPTNVSSGEDRDCNCVCAKITKDGERSLNEGRKELSRNRAFMKRDCVHLS
jgi:hypothetical protein